MEYIIALLTGAATFAACIFFILRRQNAKQTPPNQNPAIIRAEKERAETKERIEALIRENGEEVRRIMEKINRYAKILILAMLPAAASGQASQIEIPKMNYKDVFAVNKPGLIFSHADSIIIITPERHRFYEGLIQDAIRLSKHYEVMLAGKDTLLQMEQARAAGAESMLADCGASLEQTRSKTRGGWFGTTGKILAASIIAIVAIGVYAKVF